MMDSLAFAICLSAISKWRFGYFFGYFTVPLIAMLVGNVAIFMLGSKIENDEVKLVFGAVAGLALFLVIIKLVRWLASKSGISTPHFGDPRSFATGLAIGLIATILSGFLYAKQNEREINWPKLKQETSQSVFTAITPATSEEATFRFG
jgi:hypothetical protein